MKPTDKTTLFHNDPIKAQNGVMAFAEADPRLARAYSEGYDVADKVAELFTDQLLAKFESDDELSGRVRDVLVANETPFSLAQTSERKAPRAEAFEVYDAIRRITDNTTAPHGFCLDVSRIQRFKSNPAHMTQRTVVLVTINTPLQSVRERVIVVDCEEQSE